MNMQAKGVAVLLLGILSMGSDCTESPELVDSPVGTQGASSDRSTTSETDGRNTGSDDGMSDGRESGDDGKSDDPTDEEADASAPALTISLTWTDQIDLDLHVRTPAGEEIYYRNRESADGGRFAKDGCLATRCDGSEPAIEAVVWQRRAPGGTYEVWALNYDGESPVSFTVTAKGKGIDESFTGTVSSDSGSTSDVFTFQVEGKNCDGTTAENGSECLGRFKGTYYYVSNESDYSGSDNTTLFDANCRAITKVPASFSDSACIEGTGRLADGRIVNYETTCSCGRSCPTGGTVCYSVLGDAYPWGKGTQNLPLDPMRSWAVDRGEIAIGTVVYVPEWDGVQIPKVGEVGGFTHDGCFKAVDVGGAIRGKRFDLFSGTAALWKKLERIIPSMTEVEVYINEPKCSGLR